MYVRKVIRVGLVPLGVFVVVGALLVPAAYLAVQSTHVPPVHAAACQSSNGYCGQGFRTAALDVGHYAWNGEAWVTRVEPDSGESWSITAYWNTAYPPLPCYETSETATVDVDWAGAAWVLSNKSLTNHILDIQLCDIEGTCGTQLEPHGYAYKLMVKVVDPNSGTFNLRVVTFTTTSVGDGNELWGTPCVHRYSVSPTSQTFSQDDTGYFECGYSCDNSGASITLTYQ